MPRTGGDVPGKSDGMMSLNLMTLKRYGPWRTKQMASQPVCTKRQTVSLYG